MSNSSFSVVRPRVVSELTGDTLLFEDVVASHLAADEHGVLVVYGGPLTGKTTAIEYLDRVFPEDCGLVLLDDQARLTTRACPRRGITIVTKMSESGSSPIARYPLAAWGPDEWIAYLLAAHKDFKSPEDIRKANLCGADLRGAKIDGVDFYLVDLRAAHYDPDQESHFQRCGAILKTRAV